MPDTPKPSLDEMIASYEWSIGAGGEPPWLQGVGDTLREHERVVAERDALLAENEKFRDGFADINKALLSLAEHDKIVYLQGAADALKERDAARAELADQMRLVENLRLTIEDKRREIVRLSAELAEAQEDRDSANRCCGVWENLNVKLTKELAAARADINWLRRLISWCRPRLKPGTYATMLDTKLAAGISAPPDENEPAIVQSSECPPPDDQPTIARAITAAREAEGEKYAAQNAIAVEALRLIVNTPKNIWPSGRDMSMWEKLKSIAQSALNRIDLTTLDGGQQ